MKKIVLLFYFLTILLFFLWLIRPVLFHQLSGTFKSHIVPSEYQKLENFLYKQTNFSRTLWVPTVQRFGFNSQIHPMVDGYNFFHVASPAGVLALLPNSELSLQESSIKYVIVPYDSEGEIFLKDRKYDAKLYEQTVSSVKKIGWLSEITGFDNIHVFEVKNIKDHFWSSTNQSLVGSYRVINPTKYTVSFQDAKKGDVLIFSEGYDPYWQLVVGRQIISSRQYKQFNSFLVPKDGVYSVEISYKPQEWVNIGLWISGITAVGVIFVLLRFASKRKHV